MNLQQMYRKSASNETEKVYKPSNEAPAVEGRVIVYALHLELYIVYKLIHRKCLFSMSGNVVLWK